MDSLIMRAARLACRCHAGQVRKYHGRPYIEHPARVAARAMFLEDSTPEEVAAAWLHDVLEDCAVTADDLRSEGIPESTIVLVQELTNPSQSHPHLRRRQRKEIDRQHLSHVSREAKRIKLIDRIDNLGDLQACDADFRGLYVAESVLLAKSLQGVDNVLLDELHRQIEAFGFPRTHTDDRLA